MEWDSKIPSLDLAELEQTVEVNIGAIVEPSRSLGNQVNGMDCSVDLKLGGSEPPLEWKDQSKMTMMTASSLSSPSKRARAPSTARLVVSCSVDGCKADLSNCREYHRRHKVCEIHSKTSIVVVRGVEQRFCQQCSRFHLLVEFDEVKRSCRKRLDGHNRRRRKPHPDSVTPPTIFPIQQGFPASVPGCQHMLRYLNLLLQNSTGLIGKKQNSTGLELLKQSKMHSTLITQPCILTKVNNTFLDPFLLTIKKGSSSLNRTAIEPSVCQPLLNTASTIEWSSSSSKMLSNRLTQVLDSDCAFSHLSSPSQSSSMNAGQMLLPAGRITISRPLVSSLQYHGLDPYAGSVTSGNILPSEFSCSGVEGEQVGGVVVSDTDAGLRCQGIVFHEEGEGSRDCVSESLLFSW